MWEWIVWIVVGVVVVAAVLRIASLVNPAPFPPWLTPLLESPVRKLIFSQRRAIEWSGLRPGMLALEVGPGGGYLTGEGISRLGSEGRLVCLDIQIEMLRKVRGRYRSAPPALVCASGSELPFRGGVFDLAFLVTVFGEIPDKAGAMREYARVLRPGGTLSVTEALPDPDYVRKHVLLRFAERAGLEPREYFGRFGQYTQRIARPQNLAGEGGDLQEGVACRSRPNTR